MKQTNYLKDTNYYNKTHKRRNKDNILQPIASQKCKAGSIRKTQSM